MAKLAFGTTVPIESIPCRGISTLDSVDFEYAKEIDCTIKLVGIAKRLSNTTEHDGDLSVFVSPVAIPKAHMLASTSEGDNKVIIKSSNVGITSYTGPGAGRFPTANSVVADICRIASALSSGYVLPDPFPLNSTIELDQDFISKFFIRGKKYRILQ